MRFALLALLGVSFGALSAAGVFTVLAAVGLVPRFVGKTHTGTDVKHYENMIVLGTIVGGLCSLYEKRILLWRGHFLEELQALFGGFATFLLLVEFLVLVAGGIFCGMFVGSLALAIAEMIDNIPVFARRAKLKKGIGMLVLSVAAGKFIGSLLYFLMERTGW